MNAMMRADDIRRQSPMPNATPPLPDVHEMTPLRRYAVVFIFVTRFLSSLSFFRLPNRANESSVAKASPFSFCQEIYPASRPAACRRIRPFFDR